MIEIIATVASLLGLSAKGLLATVRKLQRQADAEAEDNIRMAHIEADRAITRYGLATRLLVEYYRDRLENGGQIYSFCIDGQPIEIAIMIKPEWIGLAIPSDRIKCEYDPGPAPVLKVDPRQLEEFVGQVIHRQKLLGYRLWDAPTYRIAALNMHDKALRLKFGITSFLRYKYTFGAAREEVRQAFVDADVRSGIENGDIAAISWRKALIDRMLDQRDTSMPCRGLILPDGAALGNFEERCAIVGTNVILAVRRPRPDDDYALVIQRRSMQVSEGPGLLQVVPAGFHQPALDVIREVNPESTVYRELFEELLGGEEAARSSKRLREDWFYETSQPMKFLRDNKESNRLECVGLGVGFPSGILELGFLYVVEHPDFWKRYSHHMLTNWEVTDTLEPVISSRNGQMLKSLLLRAEWADSGRFALVEALKRLKKITPAGMVEVDLE